MSKNDDLDRHEAKVIKGLMLLGAIATAAIPVIMVAGLPQNWLQQAFIAAIMLWVAAALLSLA